MQPKGCIVQIWSPLRFLTVFKATYVWLGVNILERSTTNPLTGNPYTECIAQFPPRMRGIWNLKMTIFL